MDKSKQEKRGAELKRRLIFKPLLSNPYTPRQNWTKIDPADQNLVLESLTRQVLTPISRWNQLTKEDKAKEIEKENNDSKYSVFRDRNFVVLGYNTIMKTLEDRVQKNIKKESMKGGVLFVVKGDMGSPLLYQHLPLLCALGDVKLIQLPKNSSMKLGKTLKINKDVSIIFIYNELLEQNKSLNNIISKVEVVNADILKHLQSPKLDMKIKFQLTDAPMKK